MLTKYIEPTFESYSDKLIRLYPETFPGVGQVLTLTLQVTENCCLRCSYCYQHNKSEARMEFPVAKQIIDNLLNDDNYYNTVDINGLVIDFIGGEPFMEIELIDQIVEYFIQEAIRLNHRFLKHFRFSMATNGVLYFDERVQKFVDKYKDFLSITVSIDGNKELHDACRVDLAGNGSYDRAIAAALDLKQRFGQSKETKMTLAPGNIQYAYDALVNLIDLGYESIALNCVFEEGWTDEHGTILYYQLKKMADWLFEHDAFRKYRISLFNEDYFVPQDETETQNWCGGVCNGMLAFDYKGDAYPCIRYMGSSLNGKQEPYAIGNIDGLFTIDLYRERRDELLAITRQSQSTEECLSCPVSRGCAWCSGFNYEIFGTANRRATYICPMHKARALGNYYYYNKGHMLSGESERMKICLSEEDALRFIPKEEWNMLKELSLNNENSLS